MFLERIINFFAPELLDPATMTMEELHAENCHEMEFGIWDNEFSREIDRRISANNAVQEFMEGV